MVARRVRNWPGSKAKRIALGLGNGEGDRHRAGGLGADALDGEFLKTGG
jgi:hypothetical protein